MEKPDLQGYAYMLDGQRMLPSPAASAKGVAGVMRTSTPAQGDAPYKVTASGLTAPLLLRAGGLMTLVFQPGAADTSLLSNLVVSVLAGQTGDAVFDGFGPGSGLAERATPEGVAQAEAKVRDFLTREMGLVLPGSLGSLLGPVTPQAGDPLYDTIRAYGQRRAEIGEADYLALELALIGDARACIDERLLLQGADAPTEFCPIDKRAERDADDTSRVTYTFGDRAGARLAVVVREDRAERASFDSANGARWACEGRACEAIAPQPPLADERRAISFNAATMQGAQGTLALSGSLLGAAPGVVLPPLPCEVNRFYLVSPAREVTADCPDIAPPIDDIGIAGTYGLTQGTTRRIAYAFVNQAGSNGLPTSDAPTTVTLILEGSDVVSITATRTDADTGLHAIDFKCRADDCNGALVSPPTINWDFGLEIQIRDIELIGTPLALVNSDGSLSTDEFASLTGTFRAIDIVSTLDNGMLSPPPNCEGAPRWVRFTPEDETVPYDYCAQLGFVSPRTVVNGLGGLTFTLQTGNTTSDVLTIDTDASGVVVSAMMAAPSYAQSFACSGNCSGITVSPPSGNGRRLVTFTDAWLFAVEPDGHLDPNRRATGNGSFSAPAVRP